MKRFYDIQGQLQTVALVAIAFIYGSVTANAQKVRIGVKDASFTKGLIETLASEYNKENRGVEVEVVSSADADAKVQLAANGIASVGKFVVLPIANSENEILTNKKLRKGVNDKVEKEIFVQPTYEEVLDAEEEGEKALPGMVYSLSGSKAYITQIFAEALHTTPSQLKGKKILGREENVLSVVKQQPVRQHYTVGDEIPTVGESYHYPDDFDIIILRDSVAVKVRGKRIAEITEAAKYLYDGFPVINGRGFEIKVFSDEDVSQLLREYDEAGESRREEFFRKWAAFDTYRKVVIK